MNPSVGDIIGDKSQGFVENFSMAYLKKINYELCYSYNIGIVIEIGVFLKEFAVTFLYFYGSFFIFWKRYQAGHCLLFTKLPFTSLVKPRSPHLSMEIIDAGLDKKKYISLCGTSSSWLKKSR